MLVEEKEELAQGEVESLVESSVAADEDERDTWHEMTEKEPGDKIQTAEIMFLTYGL